MYPPVAPPPRKKKSGWLTCFVVVGIVGGIALLCCVGVPAGIYAYYYQSVMKDGPTSALGNLCDVVQKDVEARKLVGRSGTAALGEKKGADASAGCLWNETKTPGRLRVSLNAELYKKSWALGGEQRALTEFAQRAASQGVGEMVVNVAAGDVSKCIVTSHDPISYSAIMRDGNVIVEMTIVTDQRVTNLTELQKIVSGRTTPCAVLLTAVDREYR